MPPAAAAAVSNTAHGQKPISFAFPDPGGGIEIGKQLDDQALEGAGTSAGSISGAEAPRYRNTRSSSRLSGGGESRLAASVA